tara:strand:+ start:49 stop:225 length:177 start_codon:yes stop_codon:yes gene_type:complete
MEEAFDLLYRGKCNVCAAAEKAGVSPEEMKRLFRVYAMQRPIDEDVWRGDVELSWPWV